MARDGWSETSGGQTPGMTPRTSEGPCVQGNHAKTRTKGLPQACRAESFLVTGENHLVPGELERARTWGQVLAQKLQRATPTPVHPASGS